MAAGDTARLYHRLTALDGASEMGVPRDDPRLVRDLVINDLATWPWPCKRYPDGLPVTALPREWPATTGRARLDLAALARLLFLSAGVVRVHERHPKPTILFRAAGSAGGRFPLELYLAARGVAGLADGVHWYDPIGHALVRVGPPAPGGTTTLVITGVPWRTGWRYAERGYRHLLWDAGTALSQVLALAASAGMAPRLWTAFPDAPVAALTGADRTHELPLALVALGPGEPAVAPGGEAVAGAVDAAPRELPLVTDAFHAGEADALGAPWRLPDDAAGWSALALDDVILRRGSARRMDASATVPRATLERSMTVAMRGIGVPHWIAVHGVEGLEPGLYRWPELTAPLRAGDLREELLRLCWDQDLGRDAAFVVIGATDLGALDDRGYRDAQLAAGLVEGRLHLAAYALGAGACGMTFLDSDIPNLVGEPLDGLLLTCVGVPAYRRKDGGMPGAPTRIAIPQSGITPPERADA